MAVVNEKLLRLLLSLVGIGALSALGWRIYDYVAHKADFHPIVDLQRVREAVGGAPRADPGHLLPFSEYEVIEKLNVTGKLPEGPAVGPPPPKPRPRLSAEDLLLVYVQYVAPDHPSNAAYLQAADDAGSETEPPGDLYRAGQKIRIPSKQELEVRLIAVHEESVRVGYGQGDAAGEFELGMASHDLPQETVSRLLGGQPAATATGPRSAPKETRFNEAGEYEVGTGDVEYFRSLSQEQLLASVPVRSERDRLSNEVRGLRIQSVPADSPFSRLGLRADDIVLEVNGQPATSRDELLDSMRRSDASIVVVRIERLGAERVLTYRLP